MTSRSRRIAIILILLLLALLALFLFGRCSKKVVPEPAKTVMETPPPAPAMASAPVVATPPVEEALTAATVRIPEQVEAGARFHATWTGPNNAGDYLTIVRPDAKPAQYENYQETRQGPTLELTAPIEAGSWEVRYVTARSKTVLGKSPLTVRPVGATLIAADEVMLGAELSIAWTGPNNPGDFVTIVRKGAPEDQVGNYADAAKGSPLSVAAPVESGEAEIRYVSGQGRKVLGRRPLKVVAPDTSLTAPATVVAGSLFSVTWQGPKNPRDYITVVPTGTPDGQYRNYTDTAKGSPLNLTAPIEPGDAEIRYMTGTHARVLARRGIKVIAASITLEAVGEGAAGSPISIVWTGPKNTGDYITIVPAATPAGQYGHYSDVVKGSPLKVTAPPSPGPAEIRYMSGQGAKVLARRAIAIVPAQ